jgi:hypothetical protein
MNTVAIYQKVTIKAVFGGLYTKRVVGTNVDGVVVGFDKRADDGATLTMVQYTAGKGKKQFSKIVYLLDDEFVVKG